MYCAVSLEIAFTSTLFDYLSRPHCQAFNADHLLGPIKLRSGVIPRILYSDVQNVGLST
jgi:hypothetical protein